MREIDISKLSNDESKIIDYDSSESNVFLNNNKIYKIYRFHNYIVQKEDKIKFLYSIKDGIPGSFVIPHILVKKFGDFIGIGEKYVKDSFDMYDFFDNDESVADFLRVVNKVSLDIKKVHENSNDIVIGDIHFYNILVNKFTLKHNFVDFDSCNVGDYKENRISGFYENYLYNIKERDYRANQNSDKFSLLLSALYMLFDKEIEYITEEEFDELAEKVLTLKNIKEDFKNIKKFESVPTVSYMDEYIDKKDLNNKVLVKKNNAIIEG